MKRVSESEKGNERITHIYIIPKKIPSYRDDSIEILKQLLREKEKEN